MTCGVIQIQRASALRKEPRCSATRACPQIIGGYLLEPAYLRVGSTTWHTLLGPREQPEVTWSWSMRQVEACR